MILPPDTLGPPEVGRVLVPGAGGQVDRGCPSTLVSIGGEVGLSNSQKFCPEVTSSFHSHFIGKNKSLVETSVRWGPGR